jgi:Protein of unknown function (DUF3592)
VSVATEQPTKPSSAGVLPLIAVANLVVCLAFVLFSIPFYWKAIYILHSWPTADAQVIRAEVVPVRSEVAADGQRYYDSDVQFLFTVDGKPHVAEILSHRSPKIEQVRYETNKFPVGSHRAIRYNPTNLTDVRVNAGYNRRFFFAPMLITGFGSIFAIFAGIFWAMTRSSRRTTSV